MRMDLHHPMVFLHTHPTPRHPWGLIPCDMVTASNTLLRCIVGALCGNGGGVDGVDDHDGDDCPQQDVVADVLVAWCPVVCVVSIEYRVLWGGCTYVV